ncbi:PREDICTED: uncharacterized protein LOC106821016 [Priapulus caudatus]|uniref:Uncharacterized protein LOC106821016 n=1 Tax=Priapulus caudatus TaxID=37621 RepID=A0ABM1F9L4_PRICU|nr:PREDICTED: uncharacterized protein LOC106821016 [Priapulus caudatus]
MKSTLFVLGIFVFVSFAAADDDDPPQYASNYCATSLGGFMGHQWNCNVFYQCEHKKATRLLCSKDTFFDTTLNRCRIAADVKSNDCDIDAYLARMEAADSEPEPEPEQTPNEVAPKKQLKSKDGKNAASAISSMAVVCLFCVILSL